MARHDALTDLPNRAYFAEIVIEDLAARQRRRAGPAAVALMIIDVDDFKHVNDTMGHVVGDRLLADIAQRLRGACPRGSVLARLGGDEFIVYRGHIADSCRRRTRCRRDPACLPDPVRPQRHPAAGQCQHRAGDQHQPRRRSGFADDQGRSGALCRQGRRQGQEPDFPCADGYRLSLSPAAQGRSARCGARGRAEPGLPAAARYHHPQGGDLRGAGPLDPSRTGQYPARRVHPHRRGSGPDFRHHRLGAGKRHAPMRHLAGRCRGGRQYLGPRFPRRRCARHGRPCAGALGPAARPGSKWKSPKPP